MRTNGNLSYKNCGRLLQGGKVTLMIKMRKADFDGFGIDHIQKTINLKAIGLIKYRPVNENAFETGEPIKLDIYSKISTVQNDFSLKDIIAESNVEFVVCGFNGRSVIYCEKRENPIFKSSTSKNEYISSSDSISYQCYDDIFIVEEEDCGSKKVTAFDMDLNIISSSVMDCSELNEYEIDRLNKQSAFNNYTGELREAYPNLSIDFDFNAFNENTVHSLIAACYDKQTQKEYIVRFNGSKEIAWKCAISGNITTGNILVFENCFYALYNTGRGYKWRLTKFTNDGNALDNYDFTGVDAVLTLHNKRPVIVYKDYSGLTVEQKQIFKTAGEFIGPAAMLIVD